MQSTNLYNANNFSQAMSKKSSNKNNNGFLERSVFETVLRSVPIVTFDLLLQTKFGEVLILKRKIAPYANQWALPGLRMYKGESIDQTLVRIGLDEVGIRLETSQKRLIGQYTAKFKTEHDRQDLSTCYLLPFFESHSIVLNQGHFSSWKLTKKIPNNMGAMYKFYLSQVL